MNDKTALLIGATGLVGGECLKLLLQEGIERIVSYGHRSPDGFWYDQEESEWVIVLKGSAILRFEDESEGITMNPGDFIDIKKHQRHRVEWTDPDQETIWLAVHYKS